MRCHIIDALPQVGGQLSEVYPQKPIYDIPGYPAINALDLVNKLVEQITPFNPGYTLGERVDLLERLSDGSFVLITNYQTSIHCRAVVIAGGLGCFEPRKPPITGLENFEGKGVSYMIRNPEKLRGRKVLLAGGGDSALDWAVILSELAERVVLVHRGDTFRGAPETAGKVFALAAAGQLDLLLNANVVALHGNGHLQSAEILTHDGQTVKLTTEHFVPLFGLSPKLGPLEHWGLNINKSAITVNPEDFSTNQPGIYAIGDINTYPGKLKLILSGFHEAALMAQSAFKYMYPHERLSFKYTTVYGINSF
ncbi:NAD(P)/FAD-dependent oxidoreductase [Mucilaginibacter pallidiroseus]|uniref:NAD(P)/FAD-dependent oxidoreductase n=1 Tax=Mucilaginibacter pallidiroseus TaxID=2599295 RepID=UPI0021BD7B5D|nr:NAD(P)/FAD-dependent oxidoreductase [Mucilaginibacter pallidiroseus]